MCRVKVAFALSRELSTVPEDGKSRLTFGRIGGVIFFPSSSFQSIPSNHDIFLISERPAIPLLQHSRVSLFFSTNLNNGYEGTQKMKETTGCSPLLKPRCTWDYTSPLDRGRTQGLPPYQRWPSTPGHFVRCMVGLQITTRTM